MKRVLSLNVLVGMLVLSACVTINVYFPAAAAEKAADRIIEDVYDGAQQNSGANAETAASASISVAAPISRLALAVLDFLVSPAAAAEVQIDISSPAVQRLTRSMEQRYPRLKPYFESGAIGLTADALVAVRDLGQVPLAERNRLRRLVRAENADRKALYREISVANDHPEWEGRIRDTFAKRWIAKAPDGWYYQGEDGQWRQK